MKPKDDATPTPSQIHPRATDVEKDTPYKPGAPSLITSAIVAAALAGTMAFAAPDQPAITERDRPSITEVVALPSKPSIDPLTTPFFILDPVSGEPPTGGLLKLQQVPGLPNMSPYLWERIERLNGLEPVVSSAGEAYFTIKDEVAAISHEINTNVRLQDRVAFVLTFIDSLSQDLKSDLEDPQKLADQLADELRMLALGAAGSVFEVVKAICGGKKNRSNKSSNRESEEPSEKDSETDERLSKVEAILEEIRDQLKGSSPSPKSRPDGPDTRSAEPTK